MMIVVMVELGDSHSNYVKNATNGKKGLAGVFKSYILLSKSDFLPSLEKAMVFIIQWKICALCC